MSWHKNGPNIWAILDSVLNMLMILLCCKQQAYYYIHISAIEEWCFLEKTYHFAVCPQSFVVLSRGFNILQGPVTTYGSPVETGHQEAGNDSWYRQLEKTDVYQVSICFKYSFVVEAG